ncbi:peptidoglycan recognition protein [Streptomyces sp. NPDC005551]|uniref:peptidoglycan recognition protein family protein n=1 Tax=Streptomyces sp. NPDC005551 TaxID=3364725 RepID=UPI003694556A
MRGFLASSIGVTCAAALTLPGALPASASTAQDLAPAASRAALPGSTQSLPLAPLPADRAAGTATPRQGLQRRDVRPFSLVGVIWDDPDTELFGRVQVRTRAVGSGRWSGWQDVETHNHEHAADPDTAERASGRVRGATAPLWVGNSNGVEVRVQAEADERAGAFDDSPFPRGLHLELVDPGAEPPDRGPVDAPRAGATEFPALSRKRTVAEFLSGRADRESVRAMPAGGRSGQRAAGNERRVQPYIGPRPRIVTRRGWGADEGLRERGFVYTNKVKAAFVHHTASGNNYRCAQAPSVIRSIYRYHVRSSGWRDIGYNFLVDKCGNIYEGRAGGVAKPVMGAHTLGFNSNSMGIAVLGSFGSTKPSAASVKAVAKLTAWKLGLFGANPRGKTYLKSGGGNLYRKGQNVRLNVISGHRDGFATECPGRRLYTKLGTARSTAARYQGR